MYNFRDFQESDRVTLENTVVTDPIGVTAVMMLKSVYLTVPSPSVLHLTIVQVSDVTFLKYLAIMFPNLTCLAIVQLSIDDPISEWGFDHLQCLKMNVDKWKFQRLPDTLKYLHVVATIVEFDSRIANLPEVFYLVNYTTSLQMNQVPFLVDLMKVAIVDCDDVVLAFASIERDVFLDLLVKFKDVEEIRPSVYHRVNCLVSMIFKRQVKNNAKKSMTLSSICNQYI